MVAKEKICAYCGKPGTSKQMNREHFVPRGLWEGRRPSQTLTVGVHTACNADYAMDDEYFRSVMAAIDGTDSHPEIQKLLNGPITRLITKHPSLLLHDLKKVPVENAAGEPLGERWAFGLNEKRMCRVLRKIVLALYFTKVRKALPDDHDVYLNWDTPDRREELKPVLSQMETISNFGDDVFTYQWFKLPRDDRETFWVLGFYNAVSFLAMTAAKRKGETEALHFFNPPPKSLKTRSKPSSP